MSVEAVIEARGLDVSYGKVQVLFDVGLSVGRGEVLALLGANGAGKSTLLRAVSGLLSPTRGTITLNGTDITSTTAEQRVGLGVALVVGGNGVFVDLTVEENLRVGLWTRRRDGDDVDERIERSLDRFPDLRAARDERAGSLSGGQQQMLTLAKGLLLDAEVLIVDELSLGLAPRVVQQLLRVVDELVEAGTTMILVEQSLRVALSLADRAVFLEKGQVRFDGPAAELAERDDLAQAVFLGADER